MGLRDLPVVRRCRRPTRLLPRLRVVEHHTQSSGTLYSGENRILICSYGANCPPLKGPSPQRRVAGESARKYEYKESLSYFRGCGLSAPRRVSFSMSSVMRSFCVANSCFKLTRAHRGGGGSALACVACPRPRPVEASITSSTTSSVTLVHTICYK
jgi:hypothetical protein